MSEASHVLERAALVLAAEARDHAEGALVVAALGDLQVGRAVGLGDQAVGHGLPVGTLQDQAKVRHGHHVLAHAACGGRLERLAQVQRDLVVEEIKVHPGVGRAALPDRSRVGSGLAVTTAIWCVKFEAWILNPDLRPSQLRTPENPFGIA